MAAPDTEEVELSDKEKKKRDKAAKRGKGSNFSAMATDSGAIYADAEDEDGFSFSVLLIVLFIVVIWLAILCLLVKLDIGGFGSEVLTPIFKDVPVISKILPDQSEEGEYGGEFASLPDALAEIERLNAQIDDLKSEIGRASEGDSEEVKALKEEIVRLRTFEDSQIEFEKQKTEFYDEVVFSEKAPDIENYKKYYEEIDPDNAEYMYKQVVAQIEADKEMDEYVQAYSEMKPKQAAAIFEMMTDNLDLVARILGEMEPNDRAKILGVMNSETASMITKIMDPD